MLSLNRQHRLRLGLGLGLLLLLLAGAAATWFWVEGLPKTPPSGARLVDRGSGRPA